jgi:class 3 adenylate cyclase
VALARPSTVVVSDAVAAAVAARHRLQPLPPAALKGYALPAQAYRLLPDSPD